MTDAEIQLIIAAFDNHRDDVRAALTEQKEFVKCEIGKYSTLVMAHQKRFESFDTITALAAKVAALATVLIAAAWAVVTWKWRK